AGVLLLGCNWSADRREASPTPAPSASASASAATVALAPTLQLSSLKPLARFDGDFASAVHDGWFSTMDTGNVNLVFSRQRKACPIRFPGADQLSAACSAISGKIALRDAAIETDAPERVTLLDSEPGAELSHFIVVDPSPDRLVIASGKLVAEEVIAATAWAN